MHIAGIDFAEFYASAFSNPADARNFVGTVKSLNGPAPAKIALHQGGRMVWLADRMEDVAAGRDALQILFYLIAAEAVAKIVFGFKGEGKSKHHVQRFFGEICLEKHRHLLSRALESAPGYFLTWEETTSKLYEIRCDVVHEGQYFGFHLQRGGSQFPLMADFEDPNLVAHVRLVDVRQIVLEGIVEGVRMLLPPTT
ncbi:MAG TPA: hypothetical protein VG206_05745 [Terriglobia bacterium]|nr:hypothetical protein [Terriglobia bacterium]